MVNMDKLQLPFLLLFLINPHFGTSSKTTTSVLQNRVSVHRL